MMVIPVRPLDAEYAELFSDVSDGSAQLVRLDDAPQVR